ncbi:MAG: hypothetical protein UT21_C0010G0009 [Candidatus Woesebacteria bacterium GW2011_GWA1_39_11b]|nr:MAG: hypothetical protein UT21_C0010G0009 [Candidatus Woesebacteria bacterium GW2011_GWA1_39_11b]
MHEIKIYRWDFIATPLGPVPILFLLNTESLTGRYKISYGEISVEYKIPKFRLWFTEQKYEEIWINENKIEFEEYEIFECKR